jgi:anthranilate phosphoribosyltransferase
MNSPADALQDLLPLVSAGPLALKQIRAVAEALLDPAIATPLKADFLLAWTQRGETAEELVACTELFLPLANDPGLRGTWHGQPLLDCCGTGGGGLDIINFSTAMMFVLAAMGVPVVKHGNRGQTKKSGSADVLEALGLRIDFAPGDHARCLDEVGCVFLFAPSFYPAFAAVAPARRQASAAGQRTIFNLLGPLLNPARPNARLVGVFQPNLVALYRKTLAKLSCPLFFVACGQDRDSGRMLGEASANGPTWLASTLRDAAGAPLGNLTRKSPNASLESLLVQDAADSARCIARLLQGEDRGLAREMLLLNSALAAWTQGTVSSLEEGLDRAGEALDSGRALHCLERWRRLFPA